jgi:hypothetical protein
MLANPPGRRRGDIDGFRISRDVEQPAGTEAQRGNPEARSADRAQVHELSP